MNFDGGKVTTETGANLYYFSAGEFYRFCRAVRSSKAIICV